MKFSRSDRNAKGVPASLGSAGWPSVSTKARGRDCAGRISQRSAARSSLRRTCPAGRAGRAPTWPRNRPPSRGGAPGGLRRSSSIGGRRPEMAQLFSLEGAHLADRHDLRRRRRPVRPRPRERARPILPAALRAVGPLGTARARGIRSGSSCRSSRSRRGFGPRQKRDAKSISGRHMHPDFRAELEPGMVRAGTRREYDEARAGAPPPRVNSRPLCRRLPPPAPSFERSAGPLPAHAAPKTATGRPSLELRKSGISWDIVQRSFSVPRPARAKMSERIQKRWTTFVSGQPCFWKWWWMGAMRKKRLPSP